MDNNQSKQTDIRLRSEPLLVLVRGLPGSGKSYIASAVQEKLGASEVVLLDPDTIDFESSAYIEMSTRLTEDGVDSKLYPYRFLRQQAYEGILAGKIIIWNQAFTNLYIFDRTILNLQNYAAEHSVELKHIVVEVEIDAQAARIRIEARVAGGGHDVSVEAFERFMTDYESFAKHGHDPVIVQGDADIAATLDTVVQAISASRST